MLQSVYEYTRKCQEEGKRADENEIIQKLANCLDNGEDIDFIFPLKDSSFADYRGTILHYSVLERHERVVEYALCRGANIAVQIIAKREDMSHLNALDLAQYSGSREVAKMLMKRCLELYSTYGLTSLHLKCAFTFCPNYPANQDDDSTQANAVISTESPIWPGVTPILIAAKYLNTTMVKRLLDLGADPIVKDHEGNTPLHYLGTSFLFDARLFAFDAKNTFGSLTGSSHFHLACGHCPKALDIVRRYLDQGTSPDLPTQSRGIEYDSPPGHVGLHIAADKGCARLVQLLLKYGAKIDKQDSNGDSPIEYLFKNRNSADLPATFIECICSFIEFGSNMEKVDMDKLLDYVLSSSTDDLPDVISSKKQIFLSSIVRLIVLKEDLVPKMLMEVFQEVLKESVDLDVNEYADRCSEELKTLSCRGLQEILDDTIIARPDFEDKFRWLEDSFDFGTSPIYGQLLIIRRKRKLLEVEEKRRKIPQAVPQVQRLFQSVCQLPDLCAENILWSLSGKELDRFVAQIANEM